MSKQREKFYKKSPYKEELKRILNDIIAGSFSGYDIESLHGFPGYFRIRKGKIRIIFQKIGKEYLIKKIDTRGDVYKHF